MTITKEDVERAREYSARRFAFRGDDNSEKRRPKNWQGYHHGVIQLPFGGEIFKNSPLNLRHNPKDKLHPEGVWQPFKSTEERQTAEEWCDQCGDVVFLRDCLNSSLALGYNFISEGDSLSRTEIGELEHNAKHNEDMAAINKITELMTNTIRDFCPCTKADLICSVPTHQGKNFHLPAILAQNISEQFRMLNITENFSFSADKPSLKNTKIEEKWDKLAGVEFLTQDNTVTLQDKSIILVDDKYQSGITLQFVASKLLEKGASKVFGLCAVKTWRDDDNTS